MDSFIKQWMDQYEPDTFSEPLSKTQLMFLFEDLINDFISKLGDESNEELRHEVATKVLSNNVDGLRDALKDDDLFHFYKGVVVEYGKELLKLKL